MYVPPPAEEARPGDETQQAMVQTAFIVASSLAFGAGVWFAAGANAGESWLAAYILELSLSVDNLFVFSLIFDYFQTPEAAQPRALQYGLVGAVVLRAIFIFGGEIRRDRPEISPARAPTDRGASTRLTPLPPQASRSSSGSSSHCSPARLSSSTPRTASYF